MRLRELEKAKEQSMHNYVKLAIISNISFEPFFHSSINKSFSQSSIYVEVLTLSYSEIITGNITEQISGCDIVVVIPNFEQLYQDALCNFNFKLDEITKIINIETHKMKQICSLISSMSTAPIIWFGYEDYCYSYLPIGHFPVLNMLVDKLNIQLYVEGCDNFTFVDLKKLVAKISIENAYDNKNKYRWNSPYSRITIEHICDEIYRQYLIVNGKTKKCIVLDCDNVLWGGIISEVGVENVILGNSGLGRIYKDFQRFLLFLYNHGVILTICSKNDYCDVLNLFHEHSEMTLKEKHIAVFQVNWNNKAENIQKIADMLNISLDSIVFVDDSDFEVQSVKALLPEVTTIKYVHNNIYEQLSCFCLKTNIEMEDIVKRNDTYKTNEQRCSLKQQSKNFEDYLNKLNTKITIQRATFFELNRIAELTQRTNKCTNGRRFTVEQLKKLFQNKEYSIYSVYVSDKFSDLGLVGTIGIEKETIDLFSLSCRALGRRVEDKMLKFMSSQNIKNIYFSETNKNQEIKNKLFSFINKGVNN